MRGLKAQLQPIYAGIGLAHLFDRSIILPRVACYCDKCVSDQQLRQLLAQCPYSLLPLQPAPLANMIMWLTRTSRNWNPLDNCRAPGATHMRLPYLCPMDYCLGEATAQARPMAASTTSWGGVVVACHLCAAADPEAWTAPINTFKPRWREPSFLDNPRCPPDLKKSKINVFVSKVRGEPDGTAVSAVTPTCHPRCPPGCCACRP